jgi:hypothetical protein
MALDPELIPPHHATPLVGTGVRRLCKLLDRIYYEKSLADKVARK